MMPDASISSSLDFEGLVARVCKDSEKAEIYRQLLQEELDRRFASIDRSMDFIQQRLDERFRGQTDVRIAERDALSNKFEMLQATLTERSFAQKEAVTAALVAADRAVQAALISAEKAVSKAETASEKRFESVNEFRKTLTDQTATFLTRAEYDVAHKALSDQIAVNGDRVGALELRLTSRLDRGEGSEAGKDDSRNQQRLNINQVVAVLAVLIAAVSLVLLAIHR